ncbi:MAG: RNA polymerase II C-terminal domain kinase beta subunit [Alyxoria varia]|nr:MAG: RNA polymerase II C-terminal domain kinase beta subunit [Alyxoria varia]
MPSVTPFTPHTPNDGEGEYEPSSGPQPSFILTAKHFIWEPEIQRCLKNLGYPEQQETAMRLQGVSLIDNVRKALQLPIRTYNTACIWFHKFRLLHPPLQYETRNAALAALFCACKIEDTQRKHRELLCAALNLQRQPSDHLTQDDPTLDGPVAQTLFHFERLVLEANGYDFRYRHPHSLLCKLIKASGLPKDTVGLTAYYITVDAYKTWAPLKVTTATMCLGCLELAVRLHGIEWEGVRGPVECFVGAVEEGGDDMESRRWKTTREEVLETMLDLLDLYQHYRQFTLLCTEPAPQPRSSTTTSTSPISANPPSSSANPYTMNDFIDIARSLQKELTTNNYPRYYRTTATRHANRPPPSNNNGETSATTASGTTQNGTHASSYSATTGTTTANNDTTTAPSTTQSSSAANTLRTPTSNPPSHHTSTSTHSTSLSPPISPSSPSQTSTQQHALTLSNNMNEDHLVRYLLDPVRAAGERRVRASFFGDAGEGSGAATGEEEVEVDVEISLGEGGKVLGRRVVTEGFE